MNLNVQCLRKTIKLDHSLTCWCNFQGQIFNLLYLMTSWCNCYETKYECIHWKLGVICSHQFWSWPWPWPCIFMVNFLNSCISEIVGLIDMKKKGTKMIGCWANNVTLTFDHVHDLDQGFSRTNFEIAVSQEWEGQLTLNNRDVSRESWPWPWTVADQGELWGSNRFF